MDLRTFVLLSLVATASGCLDARAEPADVGPATATTPRLPGNVYDEKRLLATLDPHAAPDASACGDALRLCYSYFVKVNASVDHPVAIEATLTWSNPANEFDLRLLRAGNEVGWSSGGLLEGRKALDATLRHAAVYEILVETRVFTVDTYTLTGAFRLADHR